jgi:hypothetical protein
MKTGVKMKKIIISMLAFIFQAGIVFAMDVDASLSFGYTNFPGTVTVAKGTSFQNTYAPFDAGWVCHSAWGPRLVDNVYAGISTAFIKAISKTLNNVTQDASLLNIMAGAWYKSFISGTSFAVTGKIFAGIALADLSQKEIMPTNVSYFLSGTGFSADVLLEASYTINNIFSAIITAGYRKTYVPELKYGEDYGVFIKKGDVLTDEIGDGKPIVYDFSGLVLSAGIGLLY